MLRLSRDKLFWNCLFLGTLFFPQLLRNAFLSSDYMKYFNPFLLAACLNALFMSANRKRAAGYAIGLNKRLGAVIVLAVISLVSNMAGTGQLGGAALVILLLVLPLVMVARYESFKLEMRMLEKGIRIFNVIILVIIAVGYANRVLGNAINDYLWTCLSINDLEGNATRLWTIYGHPLYNTFLLLAYFTINYMTLDMVRKPVSVIYLIVTSLLGILLTASKSGILILLFLVILLMFKNIRLFLAEVVAILVVNFMGMFELIMERFSGSSFSSFRIEKFILILQMSFFSGFRLLYGYGSTYALRVYNKLMAGASAGFEMPVLAYSLDYGMLYTAIFMGLTVGVPAVKMMKRRQWQMLFCYMAATGFIHTYNGIAIHGDYLGVYIFYVILMLKLSDLKYEGN